MYSECYSDSSASRAEERLSLLFKVTLLHEKVHFHLSVTYNFVLYRLMGM